MPAQNNRFEMIAWWLVIIAALNVGIMGLFNYDIFGQIFGYASGITRAIYILFGVAGVYLLITSKMRRS